MLLMPSNVGFENEDSRCLQSRPADSTAKHEPRRFSLARRPQTLARRPQKQKGESQLLRSSRCR